MTLFKDKYRIESIRRPNWDYSCPAVYFITFCVQDRAQILGNIVNGAMHLSELGNIVESEILKSIEIRKQWIFHTWVVMPDHIHFLIEILPVVETDRLNVETDCSLSLHDNSTIPQSNHLNINNYTIPQSNNSAQPNNQLIPKRAKKSISSFVAIFKALTTKQINELAGWVDAKIWQSNYYDKIIKQSDEFEQTYHYINNNPALWSDKQL